MSVWALDSARIFWILGRSCASPATPISVINVEMSDCFSARYDATFGPVYATSLLTPEDTASCATIVNAPISRVLGEWVHPQSSTDTPSPMVTTLTMSPYLSPKNIFAPVWRASSIDISWTETGSESVIYWLMVVSI